MNRKIKQFGLLAFASLLLGTSIFMSCSKEQQNSEIKNETDTVSALEFSEKASGGCTITIGIMIEKKDGKGGCDPGWGLCFPRLRRVTFAEMQELQEIYAIPEIKDVNKMVWHINYSYASNEEREYIVEKLTENSESILLSYGLDFTNEDVVELFGIETPLTVESQSGIISEVDFANNKFDIEFNYESLN